MRATIHKLHRGALMAGLLTVGLPADAGDALLHGATTRVSVGSAGG